MASATAIIDIYEDHEGDHRWSFRAPNGKIMADSAEGYSTRYGAKRAARRFLTLVSGATTIED
jgi:uncharacterized protein YegP (UPF0339 family)